MGASAPSGYRSSGIWNDCSASAPLPSPVAARFAIVLVLLLVRCSLLDRLLRLVYLPRHLALLEKAQGRWDGTCVGQAEGVDCSGMSKKKPKSEQPEKEPRHKSPTLMLEL